MCGDLGNWPQEWIFFTFILLPKKGDLKQCENYTTIALVSHVSMIILRIILERINSEDQNSSDEQAGFWQGGGQDQITNLRMPMHKAHEHQFWVTMMDMGYPLQMTCWPNYRKQLAEVKVVRILSEWVHVNKGVGQGCVLSPYLFDILAETVMRETIDEFQGWLQIGGRIVTNLCYIDDIILLALGRQNWWIA